jgi:hypothetical protein
MLFEIIAQLHLTGRQGPAIMCYFKLMQQLSSKLKLTIDMSYFLFTPPLQPPSRGFKLGSQGQERARARRGNSPSHGHRLMESLELHSEGFKKKCLLPTVHIMQPQEHRTVIRILGG